MVTFYIVRHGETEANRKGVFQGQLDVPLSDKGREQSELVGIALAHVRFDAVYSSDLSRAAETARAIMKHQDCNLILDRRLRELYGGKLQGLTGDEIARQYPQFDEAYLRDRVKTRRPGGESFADLWERVDRAIQDIYESNAVRPGGATVAVVGHGGVIHSILRTAGVDACLTEHVVGNCTISVLERAGEVWRTVKVDDGDHLKDFDQAGEA